MTKKSIQYNTIKDKNVLLYLDYPEKESVVFDISYYIDIKTFIINLIAPNKSPCFPQSIIVTLQELVETKRAQQFVLSAEIKGRPVCSFSTTPLCGYMKDLFLDNKEEDVEGKKKEDEERKRKEAMEKKKREDDEKRREDEEKKKEEEERRREEQRKNTRRKSKNGIGTRRSTPTSKRTN